MSLSATIDLSINATHTKVRDNVANFKYPLALSKQVALADGVGANQANTLFDDIVTIADGGTQSLDLTGVLKDAFGDNFDAVKIKAIYIESVDANTTVVTVGNDAAAFVFLGAAAHTVALGPGDFFCMTRRGATGLAVVAGTGDVIKLANAAGAIANVRVVILGTLS